MLQKAGIVSAKLAFSAGSSIVSNYAVMSVTSFLLAHKVPVFVVLLIAAIA